MPRPLRLATFLAPSIRPVYQAIADRIARHLGRPAELVIGTSFAQFAASDVDAGFICGLPYVQLTRQHPSPVEALAAPVLAGARYGGRPIYFSDVIVHATSPIQSFADLRGRSWAFNDVDSHSGYSLTRYQLVRLGETGGFFGRVVAAGFHQRAIEMVAAGEVDGSAIDSQVLAVALRDNPALATALRVVAVFGPSTIQPLVVARHLPAATKAAIREAVTGIGEDPLARAALNHAEVTRFVPIGDADYDDIRHMVATVEAAGLRGLA
jgi:phosphonate transport system substrate-binding protein